MSRSPEFSLAGIPVRVEPVFFVVLVLLGLPQAPVYVVTWVLVAAVSVLLHELGHAVAFRLYGLRPRILLHGFGGLTSGVGDLTAGQRVVTSLAGPLSALVLVGLPALVLDRSGALPPGAATVVIGQVVWVNVGWSLLNLAPVLPLDGGQVAQAVADSVTGGRGRRPALVLSIATAVVLGLWAWSTGFAVAAVIAVALAAMNVGQLGQDRQQAIGRDLARAQRELLVDRSGEAEQLARRALSSRPTEPARRWAGELWAWSRLWRGDVAGARAALAEARVAEPSASYRGAEAVAAGRPDEARAVFAWAFAHDPAPLPKSLAAVVIGRTGLAGPVAHELVLLGPEGLQGATVLGDLLQQMGLAPAAGEVREVLAASGASGT